jgi:cytochrome b
MKHKVLVWDLPVRTFHWILAASFATAYLLAETERLRNIHVTLGYTVLGLLAFRVVWGFVGTRYARFRSFLYSPREALDYLAGLVRGRGRHYLGHNPAGSFAVWALLGLAALTGATGYATYNDIGGDIAEELHEFLANAWLLVVGIHVAGVVLSSFLHHENLARAMLTGYKQAEPGEGIRRAAYGLGTVMIVAVAGFWLWTLTAPGPAAAESATAALDAGHLADSDD